MEAPVVMVFRSNVSGELRSLMMETVLAMMGQSDHFKRPIALNLDPTLRLRTRTGKTTRDDPLYRWGSGFVSGEIPVLTGSEVGEYLDQAVKANQGFLTEGRTLLLFLGEDAPVVDPIVYDENCLLVKSVSGTESFLYRVMQPDRGNAVSSSGRVVIVGSNSIEYAAEFYLQILRELVALGVPEDSLTFTGHLSFDDDESVLALSYQRTLLEAFPGGVTHGQIKAVVNKLVQHDTALETVEPTIRLNALRTLAHRSR